MTLQAETGTRAAAIVVAVLGAQAFGPDLTAHAPTLVRPFAVAPGPRARRRHDAQVRRGLARAAAAAGFCRAGRCPRLAQRLLSVMRSTILRCAWAQRDASNPSTMRRANQLPLIKDYLLGVQVRIGAQLVIT